MADAIVATELPRARKRHLDGSACLEGTRRLPPGYEPCCGTFHQHTAACHHDLRYEWWDNHSHWVVALSPVTGISIKFCPHCGASL